MAVTESDFGLFKIRKDIGNLEQELSVISERVEDDSEVMHSIAEYLASCVREHFDTREFIPVKDATIERRRWRFNPTNGIGARGPSGSTRPLVASGGTRDRIRARSRTGYAAAKRGKDDWYLFLHEKGKGRVDFRPVMVSNPAETEHVISMYDDWLGTVIGGDAS